jgi:hypothetical protein
MRGRNADAGGDDVVDERVTGSEPTDIVTTSAASVTMTAVHVFTKPPSTLREYVGRSRVGIGDFTYRLGWA